MFKFAKINQKQEKDGLLQPGLTWSPTEDYHGQLLIIPEIISDNITSEYL
jgi:hypothetical protein